MKIKILLFLLFLIMLNPFLGAQANITPLTDDFTADIPEDAEIKERITRSRSNILSNWGAWNKFVYLGGGMGFGNSIFTQGLTADFLLTKFFSVEVMPSVGFLDGVYPVVPIMGKVGWRFPNIELSADVGYTPLWGVTVGGTFGINKSSFLNDSFFAKFIVMPFPDQYDQPSSLLMYGLLGVKIGIGNRIW